MRRNAWNGAFHDSHSFDRRVFGGVLFGQGRLAQRDLGREAGEQQQQISFHVHNHV
jgi:hypothetical protein